MVRIGMVAQLLLVICVALLVPTSADFRVVRTVPAHRVSREVAGPSIEYHKTRRYGVKGYLFVVDNPVPFMHIYHAGPSEDKCEGLEGTDTMAQRHDCLLAMNGGPFSFEAPTCLGHIVSDGVVVLNENNDTRHQCDFGLTPQGEFILGPLTAQEVMTGGFTQAVTGFDWLVIDGRVYPKEGGLIAPRTMIGTDEDGRLLLFQVDGVEQKEKGVTLRQAALWFRDLGAHQAINLDGGGSSATWYRGRIIDIPTCDDTGRKCVRPVASIVCIKGRRSDRAGDNTLIEEDKIATNTS